MKKRSELFAHQEEILSLYKNGWTYKRIADKFRVTRTKIAGFIWRCNVKTEDRTRVPVTQYAKPKGAQKAWGFTGRPSTEVKITPTVPKPESLEVALVDTGYHDCKYIGESGKCCGHKASDKGKHGQYCEYHRQLCCPRIVRLYDWMTKPVRNQR